MAIKWRTAAFRSVIAARGDGSGVGASSSSAQPSSPNAPASRMTLRRRKKRSAEDAPSTNLKAGASPSEPPSSLAPNDRALDGYRGHLWLRPSRSSTRRGGAPYVDAIVSQQLVNNASCPIGPGTERAGGV